MTGPKKEHRVLVAVDDSDATERTLDYVAGMLAGRDGFHVRLLHVLPSFPSRLQEHGGSEDPDVERKLDEGLEDARREWVRKKSDEAEPVLDRARDRLARTLPEECLETETRPTVEKVAIADDCIRAARESGCDTIAIGRSSLPWYRELLHKHAGDELVREADGLTVWVVE